MIILSRLKLTKYQTVSFFAILSAGLFFRIYGLGHESLWLDEGYSIRFADLDFFHIFSNRENNPPLYFLILHWWIAMFGDSEFSVRFPSVVFGFLSLFMICKVGTQLFNTNTGILSSLLLSLSAFHIAFSREARTFSLTAFLAIISIYFFIKLLKRKSRTDLPGYILFSCLLMYSHIYGLFIIISQNIFFLSLFLFSGRSFRLSLKGWVLTQAALIALFSLWIPVFLDQISFVQGGFWIERPDIKTLSMTFLSYSDGSLFLMYLYITMSCFSIICFLPRETRTGQRGFFRFIKSNHWKTGFLNSEKIFLLFLWLFVPVILPFIISLFSTPIYHIKYTIPALPAFYLLAASGINNIRNRYCRLTVIITLIAFSLPAIRWYHTTVHKAQWREVVSFIDTNAKADDILLFNTFISKDLLFNYYSGRDDLIKKNDLIKKDFPERNRDEVDEKYLEDLDQMVKGHSRVWVILSISGKNRELIKKRLLENYRLLYQRQYVGIMLYRFEKPGTG